MFRPYFLPLFLNCIMRSARASTLRNLRTGDLHLTSLRELICILLAYAYEIARIKKICLPTYYQPNKYDNHRFARITAIKSYRFFFFFSFSCLSNFRHTRTTKIFVNVLKTTSIVWKFALSLKNRFLHYRFSDSYSFNLFLIVTFQFSYY